MRYRTQNNVLKRHYHLPLLTQKEIIDQINAHTRFTKRFLELLIEQSYQMDKKGAKNASK